MHDDKTSVNVATLPLPSDPFTASCLQKRLHSWYLLCFFLSFYHILKEQTTKYVWKTLGKL